MSDNISKSNLILLDELAKRLTTQFEGRIIKVGIDGFCAAGKTTIANELSQLIQKRGGAVIRATTDDFQNPPEIRWRLGENSPLGFYRDAIDWDSVERELLLPLTQEGDNWYRSSTYDIHRLKPNYSEQKKASLEEILIFDGLFLQIPRLRNFWDIVIFVDANYETCILRAKERNQEQIDDESQLEEVYRSRYVIGYELYIEEVNPKKIADFIIKTD